MNILVIHSHNANRGDEAAVKAMVDEIIEIFPNANIIISNNGYTPYPELKHATQIERFPKLNSKLHKIDFMITVFTTGKVSITKETKEFLRILKKADIVVHAPGGPSIGDVYIRDELPYLLRLILVRKMGKKYMFYAPSMGPFSEGNNYRNNLRKKVLLGASKVVLRDPISIEYVKTFLPSINTIHAYDSALQHDINLDENEKKLEEYISLKTFIDNHKSCIGITITDLKWHPVHKKHQYISNIESVFQDFIKERINEGYGIIFIPQLYGTDDDTQLMNRFMTDDGNTIVIDAFIPKFESYFQQYIISKLYAVIGMRYHSNIFSAKMCTPFISVSYEQKMRGFMESVDLQEYCIPIEEFSFETLNNKFEKLEQCYDQYKKYLENIHDSIKAKSHVSTEELVKVLKDME